MRRRLRRRPAPLTAPTPKSTIWKAPGSDDSGALRLALFSAWAAWLRLGSARKAVFVLVPTGNPPSLRFGHPDVTTDYTAFPRWDAVRVRPRFPDAPSGCQPGRSPQRSKERAERPGDGCPCVGAEEICGAPPLISKGRNEDEHCLLALLKRPISNGVTGRTSPRAQPSPSRR